MHILAPPNPIDRFDVYRFYNGLSQESIDETARRSSRVPLVKSFLIEHATSRCNGGIKPPVDIFAEQNVELHQLDDSFMSVTSEVIDSETQRPSRQTTGFLEQYNDRFFAYYTCEESAQAQKRVAQWVQSPYLDHSWFSSPLLMALWNKDVSTSGNDRFGKLVFRYESIFDMPKDFAAGGLSEDELGSEDGNEEESGDEIGSDEKREFERRKARFEMSDYVGKIQHSLTNLQENYDPLNALYALRIPNRAGRGGK